MKKVMVILVCLFALAGSQLVSAENAGIGFEWNVGPQFPMASGFQMQGFQNRFDLSWQVTDTLRVGVFNQTGALRAKYSYGSENSLVNANNPTVAAVYNGNLSLSGICIDNSLLGMDSLWFGIELASASVADLGAASITYSHSDGTAGAVADFGAASPGLAATYPVVGLRGKWVPLSSKSRGLWTELSLGVALRIVPVPDCNLYGTTDVRKVTTVKIDPITNLNSLDVTLGVTIGF